jgi:rhodanese-related sulfurtransferase
MGLLHMKLMNVRPNFMVFFALLFVFSQLANLAVAEGGENITGEAIGKQILANAPLSIQSGSDLDKARYAYSIYCDTLADVNTSEDKDLVNSLQSPDHSNSIRSIFLGTGLSSNNSLEIVAGKMNQTENESDDHAGDGIVPATSKNDSNAALDDQHQDQFHAAVAVAFVDRLYVFDPMMMAGEKTGEYNGSNSSKWSGMDVRDWSNNMLDEGYSVFKGEGDSWRYSVEEVEDQVFKRQSSAGMYQAELRPECDNCRGSAKYAASSDILKFMVLPDNEVIGIIEGIEGKEESGNQLKNDLSKTKVKGAIYGYYDSRTNELGFIGIPSSLPSQEIEKKSYSLFATYDEVKSGQAQIIDARTPQEFAAGAIPGAVNIPYNLILSSDSIIDDTSLSATFADLDKNKPVVVYTSTGVKASPVCFALKVLGYDARLYTYQDWLEHVAGTSG